MRRFQEFKIAAFVVSGVGAAVLASPAAAGRCGHSYPVDKPITLKEVARQCNVRWSELREANPGVDPSNVRPGEHLAVPDERDDYSPVRAATLDQTLKTNENQAGSSHPYIVSPDYRSETIADDNGLGEILSVQTYRGDNARAAQRIRVRDTRVGDAAPVWLQRDPPTGGHYSADNRLSYQKLSAMRIKNAGYRTAGISLKGEDGVPLARFTDKPATISVMPSHAGYRLPDYESIGKLSHGGVQNVSFALTGDVIDSYNGCLLLKTKDDQLWRLAAAPPSGELIGKTVTVWGTQSVSAACGQGPSLLVSHAVYAEPWAQEDGKSK